MIPRLKDKVAIVGFADGHRHLAPFDDDTWEFWGLNRLWAVLGDRPWTRWFEIHDLAKMYAEDKEHQEWLSKTSIPVYLRPQDMDVFPVPNAVPFPIEAVVQHFGSRYFTNSVSYMIALAIMLEYKEIGVWGVDMAVDHVLNNEYSHQRPSCEYWLGLAAGAGIRIYLPEGSDLLVSSHMYGFEDDTVIRTKLEARLKELAARKEGIKQQSAQLDAQGKQLFAGINQLDGAMAQIEFELRNLFPVSGYDPLRGKG